MDKVVGRVIGRRGLLAIKVLSILTTTVLIAPFIWGLVSLTQSDSLDWHGLLGVHSSALRNSYAYASLAALITCFLGLLCSTILFVFYGDTMRRRLSLVCLVPFFASTAARLFSWVLLFSSFGIIGRFLHYLDILPREESPLSLPLTLVFALVTIYLPMVIFAFYSFGSTVPLSAEEAAAVLGANSFSVNLRIRWQRLASALVVAFFFTFISCHSAFMVPSVLGGSAGWFVSTSVDYLLNVALKRDAAFLLSNLDTLIITGAVLVIVAGYFLISRIASNRRAT